MPDITMCLNEDCQKKDDCYRYTAKPTPYMQSYADFGRSEVDLQDCKMFWDNSEQKARENIKPS